VLAKCPRGRFQLLRALRLGRALGLDAKDTARDMPQMKPASLINHWVRNPVWTKFVRCLRRNPFGEVSTWRWGDVHHHHAADDWGLVN